MAQPEIARAIVDLDGNLAGEELKKLTLRAKELHDELVKLGANNDLAGFRQKEKELKLVNSQMKGLKSSTDSVTQVLKNLNGSSLNELLRAQRQLNAEIKAAHRNTKEELAGYNEKIGSLKRVSAEISKVKAESQLAMKTQQSWLSGAAQGFNKYFAILSAGIATFTGVVFSIKAFIQGNVELDDSMADVMKTTGLAKNEVRDLYSEFKNFNTRTPRKELLALAEEAGRLGMSSKKDIMGFVEVANQIKISLGDELGGNPEEAIREVGKLTNVYKVAEKYGVDFKQSMLMVGSALNQVAASGQSEAGYLIDMSKRMAGVSSQAGITVQDIIGMAAALDEMGQTSEVSSTTLNKVIVSMFKDIKTYAGLAEMGVQDFTDLLNTDANEALLQVLTGLNGNNAGLAVMAEKLDGLGLDGARSVQILAALAGNIDLVRKYQDISNDSLEKGTSLTNEYNVKNNNMAGNVEKIGRALRGTFVNSDINKALEGIVNYFAKWVEIPVSRTMDEERIKINALVIELSNANTEGERKKKIWDELKSLQPGILEGLNQENINYSQLSINLRQYNEELIKNISLKKLEEKTKGKADIAAEKEIQYAATVIKLNSAITKVIDRVRAAGSPLAQVMEDIKASSQSIEEKYRLINMYGIQFNMGLSTGLADIYGMQDANEIMLKAEKEKVDAQKDYNDEFATYKEMYMEITGRAYGYGSPGWFDFGAGGGSSAAPKSVKDPDVTTRESPSGSSDNISSTLADQQAAYQMRIINESKSLIEQEEIAYQERLNNAGIFGEEIGVLTAEQLQAQEIIEKQHQENLAKINYQAFSDDILENQKNFDQVTILRQTAHNNEIAALGNNEKAKKALEEKFDKEELERQQQFLLGLVASLQTTLDGASISGLSDQILTEEQKEKLKVWIDELNFKLSELGIKVAAVKGGGASEEKSKLSTFIGDDKSKVDIFGMSMQDWENLIDNIREGNFSLDDTLDIVNSITSAWSAYNGVLANIEQQDLQRFQSSTDQKKQFLQNQLDQGIISQDQYHKGVAQLDSELDKKKKELAIKQAKRERAVALVSAIVNTASAIMKALNTSPVWVGIVLAALVGVMGGLQIAKIATTPIPQYYEGKYDVIGNKDGKKYSARVIDSPGTGLINDPAILVGEKPEIIIDPYTARNLRMNFPEIIEGINFARMPQYATGKYTSDSFAKTGKSISILDDLTKAISGLQNTTSGLQNTTANMQASIEKLVKEGVQANLVTNGEYMEKHNKVAKDYAALQKQSSLGG